MAPNPACEIKNGAAAYVTAVGGVDMTLSATIIIKLSSQVDVDSWLCECITTDDTSDADTVTASLTIDSTNKTATFTAPSDTGKAYRFRSRVNGGIDRNGVSQTSYETTFCLYTLVSGRRVLSVDETIEGDSTFGWIKWLNHMIRNFGSNGGGNIGLYGSNNQVLFIGQGSAVGATGLTYNPTTMLAGARIGQASIMNAAIAQATLGTGAALVAPIMQGMLVTGVATMSSAMIAQATLATGAALVAPRLQGMLVTGVATLSNAMVAQATFGTGAALVAPQMEGLKVTGVASLANAMIAQAMIAQATLATGCHLLDPVLRGPIFGATTVYTGTDLAAVGDSSHKRFAGIRSLSVSAAAGTGILYAWIIKDEAQSTLTVEAEAVPSGGRGGAIIGRRAKFRADGGVATMGAIDNVYGEIDTGPGFTGANNPATGAAQASGFLRLWLGNTGMTGWVQFFGTPTGAIRVGATISRSETGWA